jgi:two-component system chemotaxis response regulator CheY
MKPVCIMVARVGRFVSQVYRKSNRTVWWENMEEVMRILVVDDEMTSRCLLMGLLEEFGQVDEATNGQEALKAFRRALKNNLAYDLICLDIEMPGLDGLDVLREIRDHEKDSEILLGHGTKVIMTTAHRTSTEVLGAFRGHCDAYLVKPVNFLDLHGTLDSLGFSVAA